MATSTVSKAEMETYRRMVEEKVWNSPSFVPRPHHVLGSGWDLGYLGLSLCMLNQRC